MPVAIGAHIDAHTVSLNMDVPHLQVWVAAHASMPAMFKKEAVAALRRLHARGVLHGNLELHHILITATRRVFFVDFAHARVRDPLQTPLGEVPRACHVDAAICVFTFPHVPREQFEGIIR